MVEALRHCQRGNMQNMHALTRQYAHAIVPQTAGASPDRRHVLIKDHPPASNAKHVFGSRSRLENRETQDHHLHVFAAMWSFPSMPPCAGPHSSGWAADSCGRGLPQRRHKPAGKRRQAQASASKRRQRSSATGTGRMSTRAGTGTHHCTHARAATGTGRAPRVHRIHRCPGCNLHCLQEISQPPAKGRALVGPDLPRG